MMKLYYKPGACSLAVRIVIHELNLPAEFEKVDLMSKKTESGKDFLMINPKGSVPVLQINEHEILTENAVILQYLADSSSHGAALLPRVPDLKRYHVLEWINFITTELHKSFGLLFNPNIDQTFKNDIAIPLIKSKFVHVDKQLQNYPYITGDSFRLPDAYLFVILRWAHYFKIDLSEFKTLTRYFETLSKHPSIVTSLKQEAL